MSEPILEVENLTVQYETADGMLTAVSGASFRIEEGEYFGLVGESGCGKTTLAKAVIGGLDENGYVTGGTIRCRGREIQDLSEEEYKNEIRWKEISWIPQGSMSSLDPLQKLSDQAVTLAKTHTEMSKQEAIEAFADMLEIVGIDENRIDDYPHQLSGGMQQRVIIAFALFLDTSFIIADEPTTALDVIMQDQIFKYLDKIRDELNASLMLITHDISVVLESCDKMAVMHGGQMAEYGTVGDIYNDPRHPYSILLQEAFPDVRYPDQDLSVIKGNPPQNLGEVNECTFVERCPWAVEECYQEAPQPEPVDGTEHTASCFRKDEVYQMHDPNTTTQE
jgi:oligopeptide/dipeptide ABC transporter ATP-binding protein